MTTTYDPFHPKYFVDSDLREELTRVYDLCHGCRLCFKYCSSFPTLFEAIDRHDDQDSAKLTRAEQDQVVDECFQCKLCYINCPYIPGQHEWELDFPRLMMRARQTIRRDASPSLRTKAKEAALTRTGVTGALGSAVAPVANRAVGTPGSPVRRAMEAAVGVSAVRVLPPFARQRFSSWFARHTTRLGRLRRPYTVAVVPTCLVEYHDAGVGRDLVGVYERNGIECRLPEGQRCCGAPQLHAGDVEGFRATARRNVTILADFIRTASKGSDEVAIVVPEPTCGYIYKYDIVDYIGGSDAELVASHTYDASEFLMHVHRSDKAAAAAEAQARSESESESESESQDTSAARPAGLDVEFTGPVPETVAYHAPCHLRAQNVGLKSRDLIKLTGTKPRVIAECSGIDGGWGLRAENLELSRKAGAKLMKDITSADCDAVVGDCSLANGGILEGTGRSVQHPLSFMARAYGIEDR